MTDVAEQQLIALSDERDQWQQRLAQEWRAGYQAATLAHAGDYDRGLADGMAARKRRQHDLVEAARLEVLRWGRLGRDHFGCPRPGDFPGRRPRP